MVHITLVRPPALVSRHSGQGALTPPIGLTYLAASLIDVGYGVSIIDAIGEAPFKVSTLFENKILATGLLKEDILERVPSYTDLIGVSCMFSQDWPYIRRIIEALKKTFPKVPIVTGGEHITAMADFVLNSCPAVDYCILGEGEETLTDVATHLAEPDTMVNVQGLAFRQNGEIFRTPPRGRIRAIDDIPLPAWHLVPLENYLSNGLGYGVNRGRSMPMIATRGCPYRCTFCSNSSMWTTRWIARQPERVLDEIEQYIETYHITNVDFYDLTAIVQKEWIIKFCQLIKERNLEFTWQIPSGTRSEAIDKEVSRLLYEVGCLNLTYAPESGSPTTLKKIKKKVNLDKMLTSMKDAIGNGVNTKASIIIGFPHETRYEVWQTFWFLVKIAWIGVYDIGLSVYSPYPGSELFQNLMDDDQIAEFSDEYFLGLTSYIDPTQTISWCKNIPSLELHVLRIFGLLLFYGLQYTLRPWRCLSNCFYNLVSKREDSRLDKVLQDYIRRTFSKKPTPHQNRVF